MLHNAMTPVTNDQRPAATNNASAFIFYLHHVECTSHTAHHTTIQISIEKQIGIVEKENGYCGIFI